MGDFTETKFKSLIQPIKDLATNWDINIAENLNEYLEELENIRISLDGGNNQLNFAEAALLIQGSTAIYSKKVEYLHQLVLKSLEYISNKKTSVNKNNNEAGEKDKAAANQSTALDEELLTFGNDPSLLLLDDFIEEGHNIDLKANNPTMRPRFSNESEISNIANVSRMSLSVIHSMLDNEQGVSALRLSTSYLDPSGALLIGGMRPAFNKLPASILNHSTGEEAGDLFTTAMDVEKLSSPVPKELQQHTTEDNHDMVYDDDHGGDGGFGDYMQDDYGPMDHDGEGGVDEQGNNKASDPTAIGTLHSDSVPAQDINPLDHPNSDANNIGSVPAALPSPTATSTAPPLPPAATAAVGNKASAPTTHPQHTVHIQKTFVLLDPHEVTAGSRPLRKSRTYKIPTSLHKPTEGENGDTTTLEIHATPEDFILQSIRKQSNTYHLLSAAACPIPAYGLFESSLLPLYKVKQKLLKRQKMLEVVHRQNKHNQEVLAVSDELSDDDVGGGDYGGGDGGDGGNDDMFWGDGGVGSEGNKVDYPSSSGANATTAITKTVTIQDNPQTIIYGMQDDDEDDDHNGIGGDGGGGEGGGDDYPPIPTDHDYFQVPFDEHDHHPHGFDDDDDLLHDADRLLTKPSSATHNTYEMICQQYIDGFHRGANAYARETQLSKRVLEWTLKLEPLLQRQEDFTPFDIHEYSDVVLGRLSHLVEDNKKRHEISEQSINESKEENLTEEEEAEIEEFRKKEREEISFQELVQGQSSSEVCRIFLACLQLANLGNVEVMKHDTNQERIHNDFALKLHSAERSRDIENFLAPSIHTDGSTSGNNKGKRMISKPRKK